MALDVLLAVRHHVTDGGGRDVDGLDAVLLHDRPDAAVIGVARDALKHHGRAAQQQRSVREARVPGDPATVSGRPDHVPCSHTRRRQALCPAARASKHRFTRAEVRGAHTSVQVWYSAPDMTGLCAFRGCTQGGGAQLVAAQSPGASAVSRMHAQRGAQEPRIQLQVCSAVRAPHIPTP